MFKNELIYDLRNRVENLEARDKFFSIECPVCKHETLGTNECVYIPIKDNTYKTINTVKCFGCGKLFTVKDKIVYTEYIPK